jgi:hypothetical protein
VTKESFIAKAWNNGRHHASGAGYGLKISADARDAFFHRNWGTVALHLSGRELPATVNIDKASFWNDTCRELISRDIGSWLIENGMAPWPQGNPPSLHLIARSERAFDVLEC